MMTCDQETYLIASHKNIEVPLILLLNIISIHLGLGWVFIGLFSFGAWGPDILVIRDIHSNAYALSPSFVPIR